MKLRFNLRNLQKFVANIFLIVIVGPTCVGKTDLTIRLAKQLNAEIISADSRQFYQELNIGTAKPSIAEMQGVKHHFINSHSITEYYSAGNFERDVLQLLDEIFKKSNIAILTGGSGLFIKAITDGLDEMPEIDLILRENLMQQLDNQGLIVLVEKLKQLDPAYCETADLQNTQRVVRALEVCLATGKPFSAFRKKEKTERNFEIIKIGLERPREELYERINQRMDKMLAAGLVNEAKNLLNFRNHNALQTVGYKEVFEFLDGKINEEEMIFLLKRNTRRYAKRQMTWFKNQAEGEEFTWFSAADFEEILKFILKNTRSE